MVCTIKLGIIRNYNSHTFGNPWVTCSAAEEKVEEIRGSGGGAWNEIHSKFQFTHRLNQVEWLFPSPSPCLRMPLSIGMVCCIGHTHQLVWFCNFWFCFLSSVKTETWVHNLAAVRVLVIFCDLRSLVGQGKVLLSAGGGWLPSFEV